MFGLPSEFDPSFLIGKELESVNFGQYVLNLQLSDSCSISIEGKISLNEGEPTELPHSLSLVHRFLNQTIAAARAVDSGTLVLQFGNGEALSIYDSNAHYESYNIHGPNGMVVV
jgi:hypothetical protein